MPTRRTSVLIIGAGPAGYTAAIYAARASLRPILLTGLQPGGQLTITADVENFPGFAKAVEGPWLMDQMQAQAANVGAEILHDTVVSADFKSSPFRVFTDLGVEFLADTVVIATGAQARRLGLPSEEFFQGVGVSACAVCDGFFYRGRSVVVVGGGNTAVEEALYLTRHASEVTLVHRRDRLSAEKILQARLAETPKIKVIWNSVVEEILGDVAPVRSVNGVRLRNLVTGEKQNLATDGVFVAIGHDPATSLFRGQLATDAHGYLEVAPWSTATSVPGVYAAGDVADPRYRQAVTASAMGCMAALEAEHFLAAVPTRELEPT